MSKDLVVEMNDPRFSLWSKEKSDNKEEINTFDDKVEENLKKEHDHQGKEYSFKQG